MVIQTIIISNLTSNKALRFHGEKRWSGMLYKPAPMLIGPGMEGEFSHCNLTGSIVDPYSTFRFYILEVKKVEDGSEMMEDTEYALYLHAGAHNDFTVISEVHHLLENYKKFRVEKEFDGARRKEAFTDVRNGYRVNAQPGKTTKVSFMVDNQGEEMQKGEEMLEKSWEEETAFGPGKT
ncbi:hypothetical protein HK102_004085 [Quaeritorhiza haematococci]|nr:hypothetical protein HK102_004085 [Quaeritorhiza haematococci]